MKFGCLLDPNLPNGSDWYLYDRRSAPFEHPAGHAPNGALAQGGVNDGSDGGHIHAGPFLKVGDKLNIRTMRQSSHPETQNTHPSMMSFRDAFYLQNCNHLAWSIVHCFDIDLQDPFYYE